MVPESPSDAPTATRSAPISGSDEIVHTLSADGSVAVRALVATALVCEATERHTLAPTAASALGRGLMGGILMASAAPLGETLQIQLRGEGPLGTMIVIADADGRARGMVSNPAANPTRDDGQLDVGAAVGPGILCVIRSNPARGEPHMGLVPLQTGEVARDLAHYLSNSEQTPSAVGLGVATGPGGRIEGAGGFLVQALPGADDEVLARVESNVRAIESTAELVRDGTRGDDLLEILLDGVGARQKFRKTPRFHCPCGRDRVEQVVLLLGRDEIRDIVARREVVEVRCEFCGERYALEPDEVGALLPDA